MDNRRTLSIPSARMKSSTSKAGSSNATTTQMVTISKLRWLANGAAARAFDRNKKPQKLSRGGFLMQPLSPAHGTRTSSVVIARERLLKDHNNRQTPSCEIFRHCVGQSRRAQTNRDAVLVTQITPHCPECGAAHHASQPPSEISVAFAVTGDAHLVTQQMPGGLGSGRRKEGTQQSPISPATSWSFERWPPSGSNQNAAAFEGRGTQTAGT